VTGPSARSLGLALLLALAAMSACEDRGRVEEAVEEVQDEARDAREEIEDEIDDRS
jgi:hypothetical protein